MKLGTRNIEVVKATHGMALKRAAIQLDGAIRWQEEIVNEKGVPEMVMRSNLSTQEALEKYDELEQYPALVACSIGDVPVSYQEYSEMSADDIEAWAIEASKINPRWFGQELEEDAEKKTEP